MATSKKNAKKKPASPRARKPSATLRSTSGAGFEFEDLIIAWQLVTALSGEHAPGIGDVTTQIQAQVSSLGWRIDDLLLTASAAKSQKRLAISVKGNLQVNGSGLPADFVIPAWEQWRDMQGPFIRSADGIALFTRDAHPKFQAHWYELKNACSGSDHKQIISRIRTSTHQSKIFESIRGPGSASEEEAVELIRHLHVIPTDFQLAHSRTETQAVSQCRRLIASGDDVDALRLWKELLNIASNVRICTGIVTVPNLLSSLKKQFDLRHHPDFDSDWQALSSLTEDHRSRIETQLPSGDTVPRHGEMLSLQEALPNNKVTLVFGESGAGKSALVKNLLDGSFPSWTQVWFGPETLQAALSAANRRSIGLRHDLSLVLSSTVNAHNCLVIDSAERVNPIDFIAIRRLLDFLAGSDTPNNSDEWRVVIVTQGDRLADLNESVMLGRNSAVVEIGALERQAVVAAISASPPLAWLISHDDTLAALTNLRTLAWVIRAGAALGSEASGFASHIAIADRLWEHWTDGRPDLKSLMIRLALREAEFERSFALTAMEPVDARLMTEHQEVLPLRLNRRNNHIEFEHDLAADWGRFQYLKQISADTTQWSALAINPLWTNAIRMLGQFLLRKHSDSASATGWDTAFQTTEEDKRELAGDILLDALYLDPNAEAFLTTRTDLLLSDSAKRLSRLLRRFHHVATLPRAGASGVSAALSLYLEAKQRTIVVGRWIPLLRFIIAQRHRLDRVVSSPLAKVLETWLTQTPVTLAEGRRVPFRQELTEIALQMARTVQVEKGYGVMYMMNEPYLYSAPLSGAPDMPIEVGNWALELAGRRSTDDTVTSRIAEVQIKQQSDHSARLLVDPEYKRRRERLASIPDSLSSFRTLLPPWPLGARWKVDSDFRDICLKHNSLLPLMRADPVVAGEVLLALLIEDRPERDHASSRLEIDLGLDFPRDAYPTAFWKSPFFPFLQVCSKEAISSLIALVNFCTDRWVDAVKGDRLEVPGLRLKFGIGSERLYGGRSDVFGWPQSSDSLRNGNLYCALDALERWLTFRLDAGEDISQELESLLRNGNSAALLSVLVNVAKYRPELLTGILKPALTNPAIFFWDSRRVDEIGSNFIAWHWIREGNAIFDFARDWTFAPHRRRKFLDVAVELLLKNDEVADYLALTIESWSIPDEPKTALEHKILCAQLDRGNYSAEGEPDSEAQPWRFVMPGDLILEIESWNAGSAPAIANLLVPSQCEELLSEDRYLTPEEAEHLFDVIKSCESDTAAENEETRSRCHLAAVGTLAALGNNWLIANPGAQDLVFEAVRAALATMESGAEDFRSHRMTGRQGGLKFVAHAVMRLWLANDEKVLEWESAVVRLLTSADDETVGTVVELAHRNRLQLGVTWWRLLRVGLLWSALSMLAPRHGDSVATERAWALHLARFRKLPLRGVGGDPNDLDLARVSAAQGRLLHRRQLRQYEEDLHPWRSPPARNRGGLLDGHFLELLFRWLILGDGTGDRHLDTTLSLRIWEYEIARAKAYAKDGDVEFDLPSQSLGYDLLLKLAALSITDAPGGDRAVWEPVLVQGPAAHYALHHFINGFFLRLQRDENPAQFERVWQEMAKYALAAAWSEYGLWFHGERLLCDVLGFGNEESLSKLPPGGVLRMRDLYERWATEHLVRDEECVSRFCHFLTTRFGAPLRLDGIKWLAKLFGEGQASQRLSREGSHDALLLLSATILSEDAKALSRDARAIEALVGVVAVLGAMKIPSALALQERIRSTTLSLRDGSDQTHP